MRLAMRLASMYERTLMYKELLNSKIEKEKFFEFFKKTLESYLVVIKEVTETAKILEENKIESFSEKYDH